MNAADQSKLSPVADGEFRKLWAGQTISEIGSRISREGLPLTAVMLLGATPAQMGLLSAMGSASTLVFGLAAGVVVDRMRRRPILIGTDVARALVLGTIPLAAMLHWLTFTQVLLVAAIAGILTVLFDVAYQSYLPSLIEKGALLEGNRLLGMSSATAEVLGPAITGVLIQTITAPRAVFLDALSFLVSAGSVMAIRRPERERVLTGGGHWREEALAGARVIREHPLLRALALRAMTAFFCMGFTFTLYVLYAIRTLKMSTAALGFTIAAGGAGSLIGAYLSAKVSKRLGVGQAFLTSALFTALVNLLIPLAASDPRHAVLYIGGAQLFGDFGWAIYMVNELSLRQRVASEEVLGRVNAAMQIASRGMLPLGALGGGFLATAVGIPATLWVGGLGLLLSCAWLWPVRSLREEAR